MLDLKIWWYWYHLRRRQWLPQTPYDCMSKNFLLYDPISSPYPLPISAQKSNDGCFHLYHQCGIP
jgi:hypothetical protein